MNFGPSSLFWGIFFWVNSAICLILAIIVVRVVHKYEARRKKLKADIQAPGLENIKWLFKHKLKEHGVDEDKQITEKANADLN